MAKATSFKSALSPVTAKPILLGFDGDGHLVGAILRPACRLKGAESAAHMRRSIRKIRRHWPKTEILQSYVGRNMEPADFLAYAAWACLGAWCASSIGRRWRVFRTRVRPKGTSPGIAD